MNDKLIALVEVKNLECGGCISVSEQPPVSHDVIIRLKNGRVIQISPDFNAVNIWDNAEMFEQGDYGSQTTLSFDMGGNAAGEHSGPKFSLR